jgi:hypothetical protein
MPSPGYFPENWQLHLKVYRFQLREGLAGNMVVRKNVMTPTRSQQTTANTSTALSSQAAINTYIVADRDRWKGGCARCSALQGLEQGPLFKPMNSLAQGCQTASPTTCVCIESGVCPEPSAFVTQSLTVVSPKWPSVLYTLSKRIFVPSGDQPVGK